jgi:hypothetical protein
LSPSPRVRGVREAICTVKSVCFRYWGFRNWGPAVEKAGRPDESGEVTEKWSLVRIQAAHWLSCPSRGAG